MTDILEKWTTNIRVAINQIIVELPIKRTLFP